MGALDDALDERIRQVLREELQRPRPALVTQRTVTEIVGIPRWRYMRAAREKRFPAYVERRLVIARTKDVIAYYEGRIEASTATKADEASTLARVGARRVK